MLKGKNITLREVRRSDLELFLRWMDDPEVTRYLPVYLPVTEMAEEKYVEQLSLNTNQDTAFFMIETNEDAQTVGSMELGDLNNKDHSGMFGISIGEKDCWGQGIGREAACLLLDYGFEQLNLHYIWSTVSVLNERSVKLHQRLGFIEEGRERETGFSDGEYSDSFHFGMLREDWLRARDA